ncbi:SAM-dependent methyltransferase [Kitasatospora albolonga]|uniref:SAM-dependent methyltransferase n=1 Tax=Kitasatospora albolonga TaxID=68173 RepID=UPI003CD0BC4A
MDIDAPSIARVYDTGSGAPQLPVDRELASGSRRQPRLFRTLRANRAFLRRSVRELSDLGVPSVSGHRGIPAEGNVHDVALAAHRTAPWSTWTSTRRGRPRPGHPGRGAAGRRLPGRPLRGRAES